MECCVDPNPDSERTLPLTDAAVMTPAPDGNAAKPGAPTPDSGASLTVNPTVRGTPHVALLKICWTTNSF